MHSKTSLQKQKGVSLIEVLITIVIIAIAIGLAAPSLTSFVENNRMTSAANKLVSAIMYARNEAVSQRITTRITGNDDGWTVSIVPLTTTTLTPIATYELESGLLLDIDNDAINSIQFTPDGYRDMSLNTTAFNFTVCDPDSNFTRIVAVNSAGTTSVTKSTGGCPADEG